MMNKYIIIGIIATLMLMLPLTATIADAKPTKVKSCNNLKVRVTIDNAVNNTVLVTTATIGSNSVVKTQLVELEENETGIVAPLNFKKLPCPAIGSDIFGNVNGTGFSDTVDSLKKPNRVSVSLP